MHRRHPEEEGSAAGAGLRLRSARTGGPLRIGIGGPVGSGKTALVAALCRALRETYSLAVVTNDIYTREDAEILLRQGVLEPERITAVETGCCPHTAIRDDISANLEAVSALEQRFAPLDLVLVESGGDNLTATFSKGLIDRQIFVIDVAGGDKVPRKGGPGIISSDLLVINKTDLAPLVHADLDVMRRDASRQRTDTRGTRRPTVFMSLTADPLASDVAAWIEDLIAQRRAGADGVPGDAPGAGVGTGTTAHTGPVPGSVPGPA